MQVKFDWIDVTQALAERMQPHYRLERPKVGDNRGDNASVFGRRNLSFTGEFWVPRQLLNSDDLEWSLTTKGQYVWVPVHAYLTSKTANALIAASAMELGFRAAIDFAKRHHKEPVELTIVAGHKCDVVDSQFRYYLGMAIQV